MRPFQIPAIVACDNKKLEGKIQFHLDDLTKPKGSLGRLEDIAMQYLLCRGSETARIRKPQLFIVAGDHGITEQKITPFPQEVTMQMIANMLQGGAAVSVMSKNAGIWYSVIDAGVAAELPDHPQLIKQKIAPGTADFSCGAAMSHEQCEKALTKGIDLAVKSGTDILGIGEMGIGNTASASALYSLLLDIDTSETVGAGTGALGALLEHKKSIVGKAVRMHRAQWDNTPFDALRRCGGFEVATMTGLILGAASQHIPVVVDGFIAGASALVALYLVPTVRQYLFFSHISAEKFHRDFLRKEGLQPILDLGMRLGEGTGAVLAMQIIMQALNCYHEMATFNSASISNEIEH
jgi:nicotinate-nucleotide--dimethylbenzimidazole phosphoribosyltransferase